MSAEPERLLVIIVGRLDMWLGMVWREVILAIFVESLVISLAIANLLLLAVPIKIDVNHSDQGIQVDTIREEVIEVVVIMEEVEDIKVSLHAIIVEE